MRNKIILLFLPLFVILSAFVLADSITVYKPGVNDRPNGVYNFQVNISVSAGSNNITNTSFAIDNNIFCWNNTVVANGTSAIVSCSYNTANGVYNDTVEHTFTAVMYASGIEKGTASRESTWDNTVPETPVCSSPVTGSKVDKGSPTFTGSIVNAGKASECLILFSSDGGKTYPLQYTMSLSGVTCTYTASKGFPPDGALYWKIRASDGLNTTDSASRSVVVDFSKPGSVNLESIEVGQQIGETTNKERTIKIIVVLLLISLAIWIVVDPKRFK